MVFIIVAVQSQLDNTIKEGLRQRGFEVVELEGYNYPIDAMVYEGSSFQLSYISRNNMPEAVMGTRGSYGVFMVNATGKTLDQIEKMLKTRYYSPLF